MAHEMHVPHSSHTDGDDRSGALPVIISILLAVTAVIGAISPCGLSTTFSDAGDEDAAGLTSLAYKQWAKLNLKALQAEVSGNLDQADGLKAERDAIEPLTPLLSRPLPQRRPAALSRVFAGRPDLGAY